MLRELERRLPPPTVAPAGPAPPSSEVAGPSQLFSAAYANYMTQHLDEAENLVDQAISGNAAAPDSWHRLHYQVLFDLERYDAAELILLDLLERFSRLEPGAQPDA